MRRLHGTTLVFKKGAACPGIFRCGDNEFFFGLQTWYAFHAVAQEPITALPIPPLLEKLENSGKNAGFKMAVQQGTMAFFHGKQTRTLG
jgi:hypothetical protein